MHYTVTGADARVILATTRPGVAKRRFMQQILNDGLPLEGTLRIDCTWTTDGQWAPAGQRLKKLVVAADNTGVWDLDGDGVPSMRAAGEQMATVWCVEGLRALEAA